MKLTKNIPVIAVVALPAILLAQKLITRRPKNSNLQGRPAGPYKDIRWFCKDGSVLPPMRNARSRVGARPAIKTKYVLKQGE